MSCKMSSTEIIISGSVKATSLYISKYISKYAPHQTMKIPNLEQYVAIFPKGTGTGPVPKRVRKIHESKCFRDLGI